MSLPSILEEYFFWIDSWRIARFLQHLIAQQGSRNAHVETVHTDLVDIAAVSNADFVVCQIEEAVTKPGSFSAHHEDCRVFCDRAVAYRESLRASCDRVDNITLWSLFRIQDRRFWRRYGIAAIYSPASSRALPKEVCRFADLEDRESLCGASRSFQGDVAPRSGLARWCYDSIDSQKICRASYSSKVALIKLRLLADNQNNMARDTLTTPST